MIKSYCYSTPKSGAHRKVKFDIAAIGCTMCFRGAVRGERGREGKMETDETTKEELLRLERYAQNIPGGFHCCAEDPENGYPFTYISDRFLEILGWEREEFAAKFNNCYTALLHPDDLAAGLRYRNAENSATYAKNGDSIFRILGKNGYRWVTNAANQVEWYDKGYIVGTITDITPYMELREKLEQQNCTQREALESANHNLLRMMQQMEKQKAQFAQTAARNMEKEKHYRQRLNRDALTGTYNRRYYEEVVRNNIGPAGIALMDIDDFKICNDTYGHHAGDLALETVAKAIRGCIRETDLLIRYGGDEFLLVLPGIPDKKLVFRLSRSYYLPLLKAGVRIYEYTPGFLHAKCWVSDDATAVVGSINMDYRSLFLHFECGVLLQKNSQVAVLRDDVRATLPQCREIQVTECRTSLPGTVLDSVLRLLSPLM